jgi:methylase of polypeptide subunit release factors
MTDLAVADRTVPLSAAQRAALRALLRYLAATGYRFVTITPASHARVLARRGDEPGTRNEDVLGWSLPFVPGAIDPEVERLLAEADMIAALPDGRLQARLRVSWLHGRLYLHSAYPTTQDDAVFLGPDSYRFADLIRAETRDLRLGAESRFVDIGTGAGVGAVVAADLFPQAHAVMTDLNERALALARINADHAGRKIEARHGRDLAGIEGQVDLALANPPYIIDPAGRAYRDGGRLYGAEISIAMATAALGALRPGGRLILYTGSAIVNGRDGFKAELERLAREFRVALAYRELDPDVFGEELETPGYREVDRIALIAAVFRT